HRLTLSLGEQKNLSKFGSEFVNKPKPATIIVQTKPKTQAIAILLDCSASMNSVNDEKIPLEDKKIPLEDAKEVVRNLLFSLIKLHESGLASSEVCLIPFGLNVQEPKQGEPVEKLLEHFEVASIGNTTLYGLPGQISKNEKDETIPQFEQTAVLKSDFFPCNLNNHIPEFTKRLKPIQAQGTTPLYNAMIVGLEELKTRKSSVKKLVVLSDGANYDKNSLFYLDSIQRGLQSNLDISLYFFQFENPSYTKRINGTPYFNVTSAENEKFFAMLKKLPNRADGVGTQATFKDFNDLSHAVEASFALPEITIIPSISGSISFNKPVTMPTGKYKLSVKNRNSSTPASIDLIIRGSETLKIDYDDQLNKLSLSQGKPRGLVLKPEDSSAPLEPWSIWKEKVNDEITFSVRRDENNNRKAAPIQQILQPFICFAKVSDDSNGISYALADYKVEDVYPPTLGFPLELNQAPKSVRFDLWYCDDEERLPGAKFPVPLSKTLELPNGSLRRDANGSITVDIKSSKEDRVFIICREASMVTREMRGLMEPDTTEISEKHVFTVAKEVTETTVYIVKESELNNEKIGHVYHEEFPLN
nr:hypothetical protein [Pirellula sp.]